MDTSTLIKPSPKAYPNKGTLKAFVLGCDPTAYDGGKPKSEDIAPKFKEFDYVFNLGGKDERYFRGIGNNLKVINLRIDDVYVQNLHTGYLSQPTKENKSWHSDVKSSIPERKAEFDKVDPTGKIPVLLTSHELYKVLLNDGENILKPVDIYKSDNIIIQPSQNRLGRPLIAMYRHPDYSLSKQDAYAEKVMKITKKSMQIL